MKFLIVFILISLFCSTLLFAEEEEIKRDTLLFEPITKLDKAAPVTDSTNFEKELTQTPTVALFKSMVVPGWGQVGNKKKLKALFYFSLDVYMISKAIDHKKKANDLWDEYNAASTIDKKNAYYELYEQERNRRNKYTWYAVITSFFSMFDAYVDAHLSGFPKEKEKKLTFDIDPANTDGSQIKLSFHF